MTIDFTKEARDLKVAIEPDCYPAADGGADINNHALPIIETTLREIATRTVHEERARCANIALAIDSGRGNEKEIAKAILLPITAGQRGEP